MKSTGAHGKMSYDDLKATLCLLLFPVAIIGTFFALVVIGVEYQKGVGP